MSATIIAKFHSIAVSRVFLLVVSLFFCSHLFGKEFSGGQPVTPQPTANSLNAGLAVSYFFDLFDHIKQLDERSGGTIGEPIQKLSHVSFEDGKVLTSNRPMGVGAHIRGLIHLDSVGDYIFRLQSNDGVLFSIGGIELHKDPEIHAARWSPDISYNVSAPGWYEIKLNYYQRKGSAALRLKWTPPGGDTTIVPAEAFSHLK
ncbi:MAG: hypothetical protein ACI8P9_002063 [Parasphingorhabdus sp.]|jgi:hypothetical protein